MISRRRTPLRLLAWLRRFVRNDMLVLSVVAVAAGGLAAAGVIAFREAIHLVQLIGFGNAADQLYSVAGTLPWWQVMAVPTAGGLLVGLLVRFVMPDRSPQGVAHVIAACALRGGRMSLGQGLGAAAVSALSIGVGASVGREGPAVPLGASFAGALAARLHFSRRLARTVLGCGVAAAVAASFNAPIAGALFAHEVVVGHYALSAFAPVVIASVTGTVISRLHYGDFPAFILPDYPLVSVLELPAFAILGLVCGAIAIAFMRSVFVAEKVAERLPGPVWLRPAAGGLLVGAIAVFFPQVLGVGYEATDFALTVAVMVAVVLASVVTQQVEARSFFHKQLERWGYTLTGGREINMLKALEVRTVMREDCPVVDTGVKLPGIRAKLQAAHYGEIFVTIDDGRLFGTVTLSDLSDAAFDTSMDNLLNAGDVARQHPPVLDVDDDLDAALKLMEAHGEELIAVVDDRTHMRLQGYVHEHDVMMAYNRALVEARREELGER